MVTFGDLMSLLLTFFVLLLSFAQLDIVKFEEAAGSMRDAFGIQRVEQIDPLPTGERMITTDFNQEVVLVHLKEKLQVMLVNMIDNGEAEVLELEEGFLVRLNNDTLFTEGAIRVRKEVEATLQQIGNLLSESDQLIRVTGHTDNSPTDPNSPYPSNWSISAAQAAAMVNYFIQKGNIAPERLQVRGMGAYAPVDSNETAEGRNRNRRIEVLISRETAPTAPNTFLTAPALG
ncbi:MAG: flagellar motor protein MotB [Magnetococcales bacterium]|nr:flagellar motor protein MotB [Magnetococcales bacterium]